MEKFFKLKENGTTVKTEVIAGVTTFLTMAYILAVNPDILSVTGMDMGAVFVATALSAVIATLVMALVAKLPFALAPGMGLNAFFAFSVVLGMGYSWQFALTAVFLEGIIFLILTFFNIREAIINVIPIGVKRAISVGIGLFIAFIGLQNSGIIADNPATLVALGEVGSPGVLLSLIGIIGTSLLLVFKVKGALLIGILGTTLLGIPMGVTSIPEGFRILSKPASLSPIFMKFEWGSLFTLDMFIVLITFLFVDMFDTVGTLIGVSAKAGTLSKEGKIHRAKQALFADAIGTTAGAMLGTSTVTTYVESAAGVEEGGRTGLTALVTAILFAASLLFSPLFLIVPAAATTPALVLVGLFMMSPIKEIDFSDPTEAIPAFLTIIMMPLTFSIAEGIVFGVISYVVLKLFSGRKRDISPLTTILAIVFALKFFI